jgi:1-acyl-sn-glycerol-3-phosphate acyltransferase
VIYFLAYPAVFVVMRLLMRVLGRLTSCGESNVPRRGGVLYCPNHTSDCDPVAIFVSAPRRCWMIGKSEIFDIPRLGWFFAHFQAFPIKRDSPDRAALRRAENLLKSGEALLLFPEGRLSLDGRLQALQPGAALLSLRSGAPIIPIGLRNTNRIVPYGAVRPQYSSDPVTVTYGPPIDPRNFAHLSRGEALATMTQKLREELLRLS